MAQGIYLGDKQIVIHWAIKDQDDSVDLIHELNSDVCCRFLDDRLRYVKHGWIETWLTREDRHIPGIGTRMDSSFKVTYWAIDSRGDRQWPLRTYRYPKDHCVMLMGYALDEDDLNKQLDFVIDECQITEPIYSTGEGICAKTKGRVYFLGDIPKDAHNTPAWKHTQTLTWPGKQNCMEIKDLMAKSELDRILSEFAAARLDRILSEFEADRRRDNE